MRVFSLPSRLASGRRLRLLVAAVVGLLVASATIPSQADLADELAELQEQQSEVRERQEAQAAEVDAATSEASDLSAALELLNAEVNEQAARVADAERRLAAAQAELDASIEALVIAEAEIVDLERRLGERAISSFINQGEAQAPILEEPDPNLAVRMRSLVQSVTGDGLTVAEDLRIAREDLEIERALADQAAIEAEQLRLQLDAELAELERRRGEQADLVAAAEERLERALAEAWALEELDESLSAEILETNRELEAALARQRNPAPPTGGGGGGGGSFPSADDIVNVGGIWVHQDIADNLRRLLDHAASEGHTFSGGGYRDSASQIRLRRAHCGTSNYAIYQMPASQCRPPTARPGASMHEQGKAIDFRYNGRTISSRSNPGYQWLAANAAAYGFYNLPSEPWHWSINGR